MTKMLRTLLVLMWKHLTVRLRRFVHTPIEILSPTLIFILLFVFKDSFLPVPTQDMKNYRRATLYEPQPLEKMGRLNRVFYYPNNTVTANLMKEVATKLNLKLEPVAGKTGYSPISDASALEDLAHRISSNNNEAIVLFEDTEGVQMPEHLKYTIRMKEIHATDHYEPENKLLEPHSEFGSSYAAFVNLQNAIDTSYIALKSNKVVKQSVSGQEFPYISANLNNDMIMNICFAMPTVCWLSLTLPFVFFMSRLLDERSSGIQELIKMVGVSPNTLALSHYFNMVPTALAYSLIGAVLLTVTANPLLPRTNGLLIFLMLWLHFTTAILLASVFSYVVKHMQYTGTLSAFVHVLLFVPTRVLESRSVPAALVPLSGLLPYLPLNWFWQEVGVLEAYGIRLTFKEASVSHTQSGGTIVLAGVMMIVQISVLYALSWYLSLVRPGKYGQALPWNFLCQRQYWNPQRVTPEAAEEEENLAEAKNQAYFEPVPTDREIGIKIDNVTKIFPKHRALDKVTLDVYKGEITVLLGHNGAGKTTLMNIITGMYSATTGKVYVAGMDTVLQQNKVRQHIGLCPQHNLSFPDLTVLEHVMFFTLLKGGTHKEAKAQSLDIITRLGLLGKKQSRSEELSGGMKRRLQLACALAGRADVLVLDEPTAGLDVETRRELWDLVLNLRGERTILLSTHFMEEADALGDRVAALRAGILVCHAAPMYLKRAVGTGYRVSFTTIGAPREDDITAVVKEHVPEATVKEVGMNSISYSLPAASSNTFPRLFRTLEENRSRLGIDTIGVGRSTLEEVFLKLCSDGDTKFDSDEVDGQPESTFNKLSGLRLCVRQLWVLLVRQYKYVASKKLSFILLQFVLPVLCITGLTHIANDKATDVKSLYPRRAMDLGVYKDMEDPRLLYSLDTQSYPLKSITDRNPEFEFITAPDVPGVVLRAATDNTLEYSKYLGGVEINDTNANVLYTTIYHHTFPVTMNLLSNILASHYIGEVGEPRITTYNEPLKTEVHEYRRSDKLKWPKSEFSMQMYSRGVVFLILTVLANAITLPCKERLSQTRHIHVMTGCLPELHWAATLIFHVVLYTLVTLIPVLIIAAAAETAPHTISQPHALGALFLVVLMGALAFLAFMYFLSMFLSERAASVTIVAIILLFGVITPFMDYADGWEKYIDHVSRVLVPAHTTVLAAVEWAAAARLNSYCALNSRSCPDLSTSFFGPQEPKLCCENPTGEPYSYFRGSLLVLLLAQFVVYMILTFITERGFFNALRDKLYNMNYKPVEGLSKDEQVRAEATYVDKAIDLPTKQIPDAMLASNLHKNYRSFFGKSCKAVQGISFSVKKGECFGLLGVNGAGKSTTFKMLTAEEFPTMGKIFANGNRLTLGTHKYLNTLGYCPQFFGLDMFQSGRENLTLLLTLRGLNADDVKSEVDAWIQVVGLEKYMDRVVSGYSGGCARRLACACALATGAPLSLLDEPTAGVDVLARRRVWRALRRALAAQRAVLITSHSMDEMEALCSRIAIMAGGRVVALGSAAALRASHAAGHAVLLKLVSAPHSGSGDETDGGKVELDRMKADLHSKFVCTLKDEHKTMLHYHITETLGYSELFTRLEELKSQYPTLIEDYSITETTLEEVFLSFANKAQQVPPTPVAV